jgi:hypothetical protein
MPARGSRPAAGAGPAGWRASSRPRPPHAPSVRQSGFRASVAAPMPVIRSAAVGDGEGAVAAHRRVANPGRPSARASRPDQPVREDRRVSPECLDPSADGIGARIHPGATPRRRPRRPARHPIRIAAGGAGVGVEGVVQGLGVRVQAGARAGVRGQADVSGRTEFAGIEWTSVALA